MKHLLFLLVIIASFILCGSCHSRKVSIQKVDSLSKRDVIYRDLSKTTIHIVADSTYYTKPHILAAPPMKLYKPFIFQDSTMSVAVTYDSLRGEVYAVAKCKAQSIKAKIDETITKQNDILAKIKTEVKIQKKDKDSKSSGMSLIAIFCIAGCAVLGLYLLKKKTA